MIKNTGVVKEKNVTSCNKAVLTCPSKPSVAVDGHLALLHGKRHHLHHVKDCSERRYPIVLPPKVVKID